MSVGGPLLCNGIEGIGTLGVNSKTRDRECLTSKGVKGMIEYLEQLENYQPTYRTLSGKLLIESKQNGPQRSRGLLRI